MRSSLIRRDNAFNPRRIRKAVSGMDFPLFKHDHPRLRWIAPVVAYPGEDELRALAEGALLVLRGQERARRLQDTGLAVATAR